MKNNRYTLRVLSQLLSYPDAAQRAQLPQLMPVLKEEDALSAARQAELQTLATHLQRLDSLDAESRYVETFDRGRATCLHLFEHVHGESRDRGQAMIDLKALYEKAGLEIDAAELPDFVPLFLEYLSMLPAQEAYDTLGQPAHIFAAMAERLRKRESSYEAVFRALVALAASVTASSAASRSVQRRRCTMLSRAARCAMAARFTPWLPTSTRCWTPGCKVLTRLRPCSTFAASSTPAAMRNLPAARACSR